MITETAQATAPEFVLTFPPGPENPSYPEGNYRCWLAKHRFPLAYRTRLFAGKHTLEWWELVDPDDGEIIGKVEQHALGIQLKMHVRTVDINTGKPGCTLRDVFKCGGGPCDKA